MDNKRLIIVIAVSLSLMGAWMFVNQQLQKAHPEWYPAPATQPVDQAKTESPATAAAASTMPTTAPAGLASAVRAGGAAKPAELGWAKLDKSGKQPFSVGLSVDPRGAALRSVTLNRFRRDVDKDQPYQYQLPYPSEAKPEALRQALATQSLVINGVSYELWAVEWGQRGVATESSVTYGVDIPVAGSDKPVTLLKRYEVRPAIADLKTGQQASHLGYEVGITYTIENPTDAPVAAKLLFNGPNIPSVENSRDVPEVVVGHNQDQRVILFHNAASGYVVDKPVTSLIDAKQGPLLWAGVTSAYFNAIVRPEVKDGKAVDIAEVKVQAVAARTEGGQDFLGMSFETAPLNVAAGHKVSIPLEVYFGPRQRAVLNTPYFEAFPLEYNKSLVLTSGICGFCTFQWLIDVLVTMLTGFHYVLRDWGLAIITLVLLVRLVLHPITKRSQISMSKMGKMGPEAERLKKKYGDNKDELNKAMMQLYKEQGVTPILGCLPMMLQMPIWIALWSSLQSTFELRHAPFLWGFTWIHDLAQPDRLIPFHTTLRFWYFSMDAINLLPILLGLVFWLQQKMTPKPPAMDEQQAQQQKMMQWMSLLFPFLLYSGPSGLNLYIMTSTAIGIWESKRVRDHIKEQEEREKAGKVIIDAKPTRAARKLARNDPGQTPPASGWLGGWLANAMAKAKQIQAETEKRYGKDKKK